jgi:hypothetical protein
MVPYLAMVNHRTNANMLDALHPIDGMPGSYEDKAVLARTVPDTLHLKFRKDAVNSPGSGNHFQICREHAIAWEKPAGCRAKLVGELEKPVFNCIVFC